MLSLFAALPLAGLMLGEESVCATRAAQGEGAEPPGIPHRGRSRFFWAFAGLCALTMRNRCVAPIAKARILGGPDLGRRTRVASARGCIGKGLTPQIQLS